MATGRPWLPVMDTWNVRSKWPSPPLLAGKANKVDANVFIAHTEFGVPAGTKIKVYASKIGQPDIEVDLVLGKAVTYKPLGDGSVNIRWIFNPPVAGKWVFAYYDINGVVRGLDYPTVKP